MEYVYYDPFQDQLLLTEYHFGISTNYLIWAFDGEIWDTRKNDLEWKFEYLGRL